MRVVAPVVGLVLALAPAVAHAADETREQCINAYEQGQHLMLDGKLHAARVELALCARSVCPKAAQTDCTKWQAQLEPRVPTIIITAKNATGGDLEKVHVVMDGVAIAESLDGRPIEVDPGAHSFRFEADGNVVEQRVVIVEGEKNRRLTAELKPIEKPPPPPPPAPPPKAEIPTAAWVLGGVSLAGFISFGAFAVAGKSAEGCSPTCTSDQVSSFRRDYLIADVSLGVAVVAAGAALYFVLTRKTPDAHAAASKRQTHR